MLLKAGMLFASTLGGSDTLPCTRTYVAKRGNTEKAKQGPSWNILSLLQCLTNITDLTSDLIQGSGKPLFTLRQLLLLRNTIVALVTVRSQRSPGFSGQTGRELGTVFSCRKFRHCTATRTASGDTSSSSSSSASRHPCRRLTFPFVESEAVMNGWHTHGSSVVIIEITVFSPKCATAATVPAAVNSMEL